MRFDKKPVAGSLLTIPMAFCLLLAAPPGARADYMVSATMTGVNNPTNVAFTLSGNSGTPSWVNTIAGGYQWSATGTGTSFVGNTFETFCIEVRQNISIGGTYTFRLSSDLESLPQNTMGAGMGVAKAQQISYLVNAYKQGLGLYASSAYTAQNVIQAAIWNILNETDFLTNYGAFRVKDTVSGNTYEDRVNAVLADVSAMYQTYNFNTSQWNIIGLTNNTYQDQIVVVDHQSYLAFATPAPAGLVLGGLGLVVLGGYGYVRKRRAGAAIPTLTA